MQDRADCSEATLFVGAHFELTGSTVTKYYFAGATRVATPALAPGASVRKYTIPQSMSVEYLLGDHLGSTSLTTDANGAKVSEIRYKPWGEIRYAWTSNPSTTPAYTLPTYTYTGQYSDSYINLLWYGSRHYDPALGRFIQPDSIVPTTTQGVQAWDRFAYTNNNPVRYTDPTGHCIFCNWNFSVSYNLSATVNAGLNSLGVNGADVAKVLDNTAKVLDGIGLAIDTAVAVGDVASAVGGALTGGFASIPEAGAPSVVTVPAGAAVGMGLFEANPVTRIALGAGNVAATFSFLATEASDIITGETNHFGSLSISSGNGLELNHTTMIGRDTLTSGTLMTAGWFSPIGLTSAPLAAAAFANDFDLLYIGPLSTVPKSIPVVNFNFKMSWKEKKYYEFEPQ